jgi:hypothetical protein
MSNFVNPLSGVPAVESPFFDDIFAPERCPDSTLRIARELRQKGYAVFDFPDDEFDRRAERIKKSVGTRLLAGGGAGSAGKAPPPSGRLEPGMRMQDAWKFDEDVRALATNAEVLRLLSDLYGRKAWPFQTLNFPLGTQQHYHSDAVHFSSVPERFMCGVWVALEDIGEEQGPLEYYPGTHAWPIYTNEHIGRGDVEGSRTTQQVFHDAWEALVARSGIEREQFLARKGQALIWAANLLHGGSAHRNPGLTRWSQVTHYYFEDCAYYTPMESDPFRGLIRFRTLRNIITGEPMRNSLNGRPVPDSFLSLAIAGFGGEVITRESFDAQAYLAANPDVAAAKVDPWQHYDKHGRQEGRPLRP